jgi:glycosyltransferase involved in cell wall biosynthesis
MIAPLVSVVIPVYNGERFLSAAIDSAFAQDYHPIEVIVVNDGSTDRSAEIVHGFPKVQYIHQSNQGPSAAKNTGIAAARGEYVAFLDQDDVWLPNKLSTQLNYLLEHPQIGYVSARIHLFLETGVEWPAQLNRESEPPLFSPSALLIRKVVLDQVGDFDPQLKTAEDMDWYARANFLKVPMTVIDAVLLHRRIHDRNISFDMAENKKNIFALLRRSVERHRALRDE